MSTLLKQQAKALAVANQQHERYIDVLNVISGVVFLGSPHSCLDPESLPETLLVLLKSYPNDFSKQTLARLEKESTYIRNAALRFDDVCLRVDIASLYETKEAKVSNNVWSKTRRTIVCKLKILP
jgi:hypothetical protein